MSVTNQYLPTLQLAEGVGVEPTRVVSSERFSRPWPPPVGLSFQKYLSKKSTSLGDALMNIVLAVYTISLKYPPKYSYANMDYKSA